MSKKLTPGTRVRLHAPSPVLSLAADTGVIARPDRWDGYYVVKLDRPAEYVRGDGETQTLYEIREAGDNLTVLDGRPGPPA
jgi:hypothetical protein